MTWPRLKWLLALAAVLLAYPLWQLGWLQPLLAVAILAFLLVVMPVFLLRKEELHDLGRDLNVPLDTLDEDQDKPGD